MQDALRERRPDVTTAEAVGLALDLFGLEVSNIAALPGERDRNFRLEDVKGRLFVLKVMHPAEDPLVGEFQALALAHVAEADPSLPVPRVVSPVREGSLVLVQASGDQPYWVRCVTYLAGQPLAGTSSGVQLWRSLGGLLARLDRALADFSHPADDHALLWDLKRADRARVLIDAIPEGSQRDLVSGVLERFEHRVKPRLAGLRMQVIHNDFNAHNVLVSTGDPNRVVGVIDFGDAVRAPLSQEVATAAAYQSAGAGHPLEAAAHVTAAYQAANPLSEEEITLVPDLIAVRLALSVAISSWRAALHPDDAGYILRSQPTVVGNLKRLAELTDSDRFIDLVARLEPAS